MWKQDEQMQNEFFDGINESETTKGKNGYLAIYRGKRFELLANSIYQAQQEALKHFNSTTRKKVKAWDISVTLCEVQGKQVIHTPNF